MSEADWPSPEPSSREPAQRPSPLPRVEDLPITEQGYDREKVQEAFDAFYRHAAQLDATLRTLETVDVFQRTAAELRAELRTIRGSGLSVGSWQSGASAGYGASSRVTEWAPPPAVKRVAGEFAFLILVGVIVGWAGWSSLTIVLVMALALAIVLLIEWVASRERAIPRAVAPAQAPALDEPAELEAAPAPAEPQQEGPEAMTILGAPPVREPEPAEEAAAEEPSLVQAVPGESPFRPDGDSPRAPASEAVAEQDGPAVTEDTADELVLLDEAEPVVVEAVEAAAADHPVPAGDSPPEPAFEALAEPDVSTLSEARAEVVARTDEEPQPDEEREVGEPQEPEQPEEEREDDLVAAADEPDEDEPQQSAPPEEEQEDELVAAAEELVARTDDEPQPDEEREVGEPQEHAQPEEEREDDLVAAAEELEATPESETALGGVAPIETGAERRRFRLFRRRRAATMDADEVVAERVPGEPLEPAPGSAERSVVPGPDLEPPRIEPDEPDESDEPEEPEQRVDPWEQAAAIPQPELDEPDQRVDGWGQATATPQPELEEPAIEPAPRRSWFRREPEPLPLEPEPVAEAEPERDPEPVAELEPDEPDQRVDGWGQAAATPQPELEEPAIEPAPRRSWFRREPEPPPLEPEPVAELEPEQEPEPVAELEPQPEPEAEHDEPAELGQLPVEALAEQAAAALERSRARRRVPRRARRR